MCMRVRAKKRSEKLREHEWWRELQVERMLFEKGTICFSLSDDVFSF